MVRLVIVREAQSTREAVTEDPMNAILHAPPPNSQTTTLWPDGEDPTIEANLTLTLTLTLTFPPMRVLHLSLM